MKTGTHGNPEWDVRQADDADDIVDLIRMDYREFAMGDNGTIGVPERLIYPPTGWNQVKRTRRGYSKPKAYIPMSLDEIEGKIR